MTINIPSLPQSFTNIPLHTKCRPFDLVSLTGNLKDNYTICFLFFRGSQSCVQKSEECWDDELEETDNDALMSDKYYQLKLSNDCIHIVDSISKLESCAQDVMVVRILKQVCYVFSMIQGRQDGKKGEMYKAILSTLTLHLI